jgi:hypothetical protein
VSEPVARFELASEPTRAPQRVARNLDARSPSVQRAADPRAREESPAVERSSRVDVDAHVALADGHALVDEPSRAMLEPEPAPAPAHVRNEVEAQTAVPVDPIARPRAVPQAPASAALAPQRAPIPVSASAPRPRVASLVVRGSLPSSQVVQGVERIAAQLNECYRKASVAGQPLPQRVQIALELDEQGRARNPSVRGAPAGLAACVSAAVGRVASRRAPDTGRVAATFALELAP